MALYIKFKTGTTNGVEHHVGNVKKPREIYGNRPVSEIQADGDELEYIQKHFTNLPMANLSRVVRWKGDLAQFIYDNF